MKEGALVMPVAQQVNEAPALGVPTSPPVIDVGQINSRGKEGGS